MKCKTPKWMQVIEWLKGRKEKRIMDGMAKEEFKKVPGHDAYVLDNLEIFQKHLYKYLLDYTKDKARSDVLAGKEKGVFEAYRAILHKCFNISEERRLDVEARVLNPRRAKSEKDVIAALQKWRQDQFWLVEADFNHMHKILCEVSDRTAMTILVKIMPREGKNSLQRHLREYLSKAAVTTTWRRSCWPSSSGVRALRQTKV